MGAQNIRIAKLINDVEEGRLEVSPFFQRRQVWTNTDKEFFIDTILKNYPFPEVFVATGALDRKQIKLKQWLVDGQQRLTTLIAYIRGSQYLLYRTIKPFDELTPEEQDGFLNYEVAVRDLGTVDKNTIREIFRRINSTDYALKSMEVLNAMYSGKYKQYCEALSRQPFFDLHKVFPEAYRKRMYDLTFCVILVTTILSGYYRRDERNAEYLERYNDEFPDEDKIQAELDQVFDFVERCGFAEQSRAWKQTDLFTLLVELHSALIVNKLPLDVERVGQRLRVFYGQVDQLFKGKRLPDEGEVPSGQEQVFQYLKAATKATNDKYARVERAEIISELIRPTTPDRAVPTGKLPTSGPTVLRPKQEPRATNVRLQEPVSPRLIRHPRGVRSQLYRNRSTEGRIQIDSIRSHPLP